MSEAIMIRHCAPTLAAMKTGSLFSCSYATAAEMQSALRYWNRRMKQKGLRMIPLRFRNGRALIYVYRPQQLSQDLQQDSACRLLTERGYPVQAPERCITKLIRRIAVCKEFPHEIGLFLGYPPEDVCGFIEQRTDCKCIGCWKVYGDAAAALRTFAKYQKCTTVYCAQYAMGKPLERMMLSQPTVKQQ